MPVEATPGSFSGRSKLAEFFAAQGVEVYRKRTLYTAGRFLRRKAQMSNDALLLGWRKLWNRSLHRFIGRRVRTRVDIEDLAQETYLRLLRARDLGAVRNPKAYLLTVAAHVVSEWRHHQPPTSLFEPAEDSITPVLEVEAVISQGELDQVMSDFPPLTRAVVLLRFRDNMQRDADNTPLTILNITYDVHSWQASQDLSPAAADGRPGSLLFQAVFQ
jgi:DNA-directed RNA polymerase specialized sigma24 family protein